MIHQPGTLIFKFQVLGFRRGFTKFWDFCPFQVLGFRGVYKVLGSRSSGSNLGLCSVGFRCSGFLRPFGLVVPFYMGVSENRGP